MECKRHPHNQQLQGVCPSCLRERLSHLCKERAMVSSSLTSSPAYSSAYVSPARRGDSHQYRNVSERMGSISFTVSFVNNGLKKSRSIAFVPRNFVGEVKNGKKKKKGFWSKFLRLKGKDKDGFMHSRTVRERLD